MLNFCEKNGKYHISIYRTLNLIESMSLAVYDEIGIIE